jgi:hypothetical protein
MLVWTIAPRVAAAQDSGASLAAAAEAPIVTQAQFAPAADANAPASRPPEIRAWASLGPYRPPADPGHWIDPRGTCVAILGAGLNTASAPTMTLGLEGVAWFASYAVPTGSGIPLGTTGRMHGEFMGLGPVVKARFAYGRYEPSVSATLLLVKSHLEWPSSFVGVAGDVEIENRWKGTLALGASVGMRLWKSGGLAIRYDYVPLESSFGVLSRGSANVGVNSVLLSVYSDMTLPGRGRR